MDTKKAFQYGLLVLLFLTSFLFYSKYFTGDVEKIETNNLENNLKKKDLLTDQEKANKNIIENLKYVSEDLLGNTYTVTAQSAILKEDKLNEVQLFEVNAEISRENQETIYIYSKTANYNKINNNTVFKENVRVEYGYQTIDSGILNLNFKDNLIEILENVYYLHNNTEIYADKAEIDLIDKRMKISMIDQKDKVKISGKY